MVKNLLKQFKNAFTSSTSFLKNVFQQIKQFAKDSYPGPGIWRGAGIGVGIAGYILAVVFSVYAFLPAGWVYFVILVILFPVLCVLAISLFILITKWLLKFPEFFITALGAGFLMALASFSRVYLSVFFTIIVSLILSGIIGSSVWMLIKKGWHRLIKPQKIFIVASLIIGFIGSTLLIYWLLNAGTELKFPPRALEAPNLPSLGTLLQDPSERGSNPVLSLTYGSGNDKRRPEYGDLVSITTESVNGSDFVKNWTFLRKLIWGLDEHNLPLNGRVWYPEGEGPYPLVLIVHGNHLAEDHSDPGYAYLCELLASRGSVCVSVDQNFINGSAVGDILGFQGLQDENDLRGWLLLEHLGLWSKWAVDPSTPFNGLIDMKNIALIGHSRGGEAVAIASAFNRLSHYPDDATVTFDYDFDIQSVVAIAPIDRQYRPAGELIPLENVNYLTLQGSHDKDVISFDGYNAFDRTHFTNDVFYFKSTIYVWGGNHGQFNTIWGDSDLGRPLIWLYNRGQLLKGEDQRKIAQVYISAFLDITLKDRLDYLPLFQNYQTGLDWLPDTIYMNAYGDSHTEYFLTFDEDVDVTTATWPGMRISTQGLNSWREDRVATKWGKMHTNSAVHLGWDQSSSKSLFSLQLGDEMLPLYETDQLILSLAQSGKNLDDDGTPVPIDFSLELIDITGERAIKPLSKISSLQPELNPELMKASFLSKGSNSEVIFQTYLFDITGFLDENPNLDITDLTEINLVFDRSKSGNIVLDNLGIRRPNFGTIE